MKKIKKNYKILIPLLLLAILFSILLIPVANSPMVNTTNQTHPVNNTESNTTTQENQSLNTTQGNIEQRNQTPQTTPEPDVELILNPYEKYNPPVTQKKLNNHYIFAVEYLDAESQPSITLEKTLTEILGQEAVWVRQLNNNYDNQVRHDYITKILFGKYYTYYVVPITAIFIDDKLAIVFTGSWSKDTIQKFITWYINNDLVTPGRFLFIDITEAQNNYGQVTAKLINSRVKYNALIDLFLQQGKYKYNRIHILAMNPT